MLDKFPMDQSGANTLKRITKYDKNMQACRHCQNGNQDINRYPRKHTCIIFNVNSQNLNAKKCPI